eukprot:g13575.t1 g13575   contig82:33939-35021(-)
MKHQNPSNQVLTEQLLAELLAMLKQEQTAYAPSGDYLSPSSLRGENFSGAPTPSPDDRRLLCLWSYDIIDLCELDRSVACIAFSYFDRFMSSDSRRARFALVSRHEFQLAFCAALVIALKARSGMNVEFDFVSKIICKNMYRQDEIVEMELEILKALRWRLNGPCCQDFVRYFMEIPSTVQSNPYLVSILTELAENEAEVYMSDYTHALRNPSKIAFTSLLTAVKGVDPTLFHPTDKLEFIQMVSKVTGIGAGNFFLHTPVDEIVSFFDLKEERVHHTTYKHQECVVHRSTNHQCKVSEIANQVAPTLTNFHNQFANKELSHRMFLNPSA